jgi:hypothetical protein
MNAHEDYFNNPKLVKLLLSGYKGKAKSCLKEPPPAAHDSRTHSAN